MEESPLKHIAKINLKASSIKFFLELNWSLQNCRILKTKKPLKCNVAWFHTQKRYNDETKIVQNIPNLCLDVL